MIDPEQLKQLIVEALWLAFLVAIIWMVLRIVGLWSGGKAYDPDNRVEAVGNFPDDVTARRFGSPTMSRSRRC